MRKRSTVVKAGDEASARQAGARELGVDAEAVRAAPAGPGRFRVDVVSADAEIEIEVAPDGLEVRIADSLAAIGQGAPLGEPSLRRALERKGITKPPEPEALAAFLDRIQRRGDPKGIVLLRGTPAQPAQDALIEAEGNLAQPVFPGDLFARKRPAVEAVPGRSVLDTPIAPPGRAKARDVPLTAKEGCAPAPDGGGILASVYGLALLAGCRASVRPLLQIAPDRMSVTGAVYGSDFSGQEVTLRKLREALDAAGVRAPLDEEAARAALETARRSGKPMTATLARGTPPVAGKDGRLERIAQEAAKIGTVCRDGRIDYHDRGAIHAAVAGAEIARIHPPVPGTAGCDVLGNPVPAVEGSPVACAPGENATLSADGRTFRAGIDGMVVFAGGTISVTEVYEIARDVDYACGDVRLEKGSVAVQGSVLRGFKVACPGNILVGETLDHGGAEAGGEVTVGRGMVGASVHAGAGVRAHFAEGSTLCAGGDIEVDNDLTNCQCTAGGRVVTVLGKGRIQGGEVHAAGGVEANEIGSDLGVATLIVVGRDRPEEATLAAEKREHEGSIAKIDRALGTGDPRALLLRVPAPKRPIIATLLKARIAARERIGRIDAELAEILHARQQEAKARVLVHRIIHPGTALVIAGCRMDVKKPHAACQFYYDVERGMIRMAGLG